MGWTKTRSELALALQRDPLADVTDLRRQLKAERLEEHIAKVVADWPPLTPEQRDRLAVLLRPAVGEGRAGPPRAGRHPGSGSDLPHIPSQEGRGPDAA